MVDFSKVSDRALISSYCLEVGSLDSPHILAIENELMKRKLERKAHKIFLEMENILFERLNELFITNEAAE